ncbi:MAG: dihydrolipoamide acetyltransferase family protein [Proteobacteria bacterium]|nr:dihydrolipoamide acetyltransferase family protein [Pseudomonadota bacterium]
MAFKFHLPDIGEGVVEGEIVSWKVKVGDKVKLDQPIVEVMTDKATVEIPSPRAGTIARINFKDGDICPVGQILLEIEEEGGSAPAEAPRAPHGHAPAPRATNPPVAAAMTTSITSQNAARDGAIEVIDVSAPNERVLATPATRRLARQLGVEIGRVPPTGKHGRVTTEDVRGYSPATAKGSSSSTPTPAYTPMVIAKGGEEERIPLRGMRKKIAESMSRSVHTAAHFTYVEEIDMTELVQEIVRKKYYHVGIAAQGPNGLVVSVVRDADKRSIFDLSREIERLGDAVRTNTATREELSGSTFTVSSLGKLGGVLATPIINFPEVAVVGVHKIEEKPAVRNGQIVARHLMNLSISVDHRLADGWDGAMFLQDVKSLLEDPTTMFMEMI